MKRQKGKAGKSEFMQWLDEQLEQDPEFRKRVDEAARFVDLDRLAVSPQCGFASVDTGNPISPAAQEQKLRLVVELAHDILGTV